MTEYALVLDRVDALCGQMSGSDRNDAAELVRLCRELQLRSRTAGKLSTSGADLAVRRQLGRLTETLGRRSTNALPAAALGRAALADLAGDVTIHQQSLKDCDAKLVMLGL